VAEIEKKFSHEELKSFNGENGRPIYIAYKGRVIDVTASKMWRGGTHMKRHAAGQDLTAEMQDAPHDIEVLDRYPQVGVLAPEEAGTAQASTSPGIPEALDRFLTRHPFFLRHPHPMTVHFPIVFMICAPLFSLLYLLTGVQGFEITAVNCLGGGLLFCLVVIPTGLFTWRVNYMARPMVAVTVKIVLSIAMFVDGCAAFIWRLLRPEIALHASGPGVAYLVLLFLLLPMVLVVAWYGATLTFPLHSDKRKST
jgi:predicted heme/steroid binding protein/uncharacterized membrane protein